jgi:hypothetical protein
MFMDIYLLVGMKSRNIDLQKNPATDANAVIAGSPVLLAHLPGE